ncbi:hypothetical protein [Dyella nitratireducens]|nr:hypothetical protein [Dyella nitratireducens]
MLMERAAVIAACVGLCGCAGIQGYPDRSFTANDDLAALKQYQSSAALAKYDATSNSNGEREQWRNEVLEARIQDINLHFDDFQQSLYKQGIGFGVGTDWLVLGLTGYGALATKGVSNALSAAAAGVTGARSSYDKEALYSKTLIVLMGQMVAQRQSVLVIIRNGEKLDASSYPLTRGLADIDAYYNAGTIPGALMAVSANSGAQAKQAQIDLAKLNGVPQVAPEDPSVQVEKNSIKNCISKLDEPTATKIVDSTDFIKLEADLNFAVPSNDASGTPYTAVEKILYLESATKSADQVDTIKSLAHCAGSN